MDDTPAANSDDTTEEPRSNKRPLIVAAIGVLAVAIAITTFVLLRQDGNTSAAGESDSASATTPSASESVTTSAPSDSATTTAPTTPPSASPTDQVASTEPAPPGVVVLITSQSWNATTQSIEVVGAVQGIATETSTCVATVTGPATSEASVPGVFDGNATSCGLIAVPMQGQPSGTYQVTVTFEAATGTAVSEPVTVQIP